MASLGERLRTDSRTCLKVTVDGTKLILCSLRPGQLEQQLLNLVFTEGENVSFSISGNSPVYLSGNFLINEGAGLSTEEYLKTVGGVENTNPILSENVNGVHSYQESLNIAKGTPEHDDVSDVEELVSKSEEGSDDQVVFEISDDETGSSEDESEHELETDISKIEGDGVIVETKAPPAKRKMNETDDTKCSKSYKFDRNHTIAPDEECVEYPIEEAEIPKEIEVNRSSGNVNKTAKAKKKTRKIRSDNEAARSTAEGLIIEDLSVGHGKAVKKGSQVWLNYTAHLTSGKIVDKTHSGKPFKCRLNFREVIQGLEKGMIGMKVGGKRKLTIPSNLAYGRRGNPPHISPNEDLVYIINLVKIRA
ncbi:peptidylprolyl isomerase fpr3, variant 2 [Basidiobolus ranarum]